MPSKERKDHPGEEEKDPREEEREEAEGEEPAAEDAGDEGEPGGEEAAAAPAAGAGDAHRGDEPAADPDEMDEGWPRSWIVTTVILGVVAIIIIARLVGQTWRKDVPTPMEPQGPEAKVEGKMGEPPPKMEPGKRPPSKMAPGGPEPKDMPGQPPRPPGPIKTGQLPPLADGVVALARAGEVSLGGGLHGIDSDGSFVPMDNPKAPIPEKCLRDTKGWTGIRIEVMRKTPQPTFSVMLWVSAMGGPGAQEIIFPAGQKMAQTAYLSLGSFSNTKRAVMLRNDRGLPLGLTSVQAILTREVPAPAGQETQRYKIGSVNFTDAGVFCVGKDGKVRAAKPDAEPPAECRFATGGGANFNISFTPTKVEMMPLITLRATQKGLPPLFIVTSPMQEQEALRPVMGSTAGLESVSLEISCQQPKKWSLNQLDVQFTKGAP